MSNPARPALPDGDARPQLDLEPIKARLADAFRGPLFTHVETRTDILTLLAEVEALRAESEHWHAHYDAALANWHEVLAEVESLRAAHAIRPWEKWPSICPPQECCVLAQQKSRKELAAFGYEPNQLQMKYRDGFYHHSLTELAIVDALVEQGGTTAWGGDGVGCVAQMIDAQARRAEKAEAELVAVLAAQAQRPSDPPSPSVCQTDEALRLISSLGGQLREGDPNGHVPERDKIAGTRYCGVRLVGGYCKRERHHKGDHACS